MEKSVFHCDACGTSLRESAFENGRAFVLLKKRFCAKCFEKLPGNAEAMGVSVPSGDEDTPSHESTAKVRKGRPAAPGPASGHPDSPDGPTARAASTAAEADRRSGPRYVPPRESELVIKQKGLAVLLGNIVEEWLEVSESGLRAIVSRKLAIGDHVTARIRYRPLHSFELSLSVRYVHLSVKMPHRYVTGFKFLEPPGEFRSFVREKLCRFPVAGWRGETGEEPRPEPPPPPAVRT